ncbi:MAG: hypothetical protein HWD92_06345 [Flavobacteriia bacterium]|nr:hypothetical protein [Flavobacteriia bacterium]
MNKAIYFLASMFLCLSASAQDEGESSIHTVKATYGWNTYQEIPTGFRDQDETLFYAGEISVTGVYALSWTVKQPYSNYEFGLSVGYERSSAPLFRDQSQVGSYNVDHYLILGQMHFDYWTSDKWRLGANFFLGGGWDSGNFSEGVERFNYTQVDYHYQIDALSLSYGEKVGFELNAGYGALGYIRGGFFHRF